MAEGEGACGVPLCARAREARRRRCPMGSLPPVTALWLSAPFLAASRRDWCDASGSQEMARSFFTLVG